MINRVTKILLVATSLAPALLVMAVDTLFRDPKERNTEFAFQLIAIAISLVCIAWGVMTYTAWKGEKQPLQVKKAKNSDKQVLTFLLAYLLPILNDHKYLFKDFNIPTIVLMLLISITIYHSNAFDFNPLLGMLGYHFYEMEGDSGFPYLVLSREAIKKPCQTLRVVELCDYTYLHVGTD